MFKKRTTGKILVLSAVAVCVCFTMLLGTTFAWFTDRAETMVNTIKTGKFDIQLLGKDDQGAFNRDLTANNTTLKFLMADGSEYSETDTYWEPGVTFITEEFVLKNNGNYALEFRIDVISNAEIIANTQDRTLFSPVDANDATSEPAITLKVMKVNDDGSLTDTALITSNGSSAQADGTGVQLLKGNTSDKYVIQAKMSENAGNEFQDLSISDIALVITATQTPYETDSVTEKYDESAAWPSVTTEAVTTTAP